MLFKYKELHKYMNSFFHTCRRSDFVIVHALYLVPCKYFFYDLSSCNNHFCCNPLSKTFSPMKVKREGSKKIYSVNRFPFLLLLRFYDSTFFYMKKFIIPIFSVFLHFCKVKCSLYVYAYVILLNYWQQKGAFSYFIFFLLPLMEFGLNFWKLF